MKIIESQSSFVLRAVLTDAEALLYREVSRTQQPVAIPEFDNKKFIIQELRPCKGEAAPANSWHLVIRQETPERILGPTGPAAPDSLMT